jgi:SAM-dependent methyltransferase
MNPQHRKSLTRFLPSLNPWLASSVIAAAIVILGPVPALADGAAPAATSSQTASPAPDPEQVERWDARYRGDARPSWDTGRPSTELKRMVEQGILQPSRIVELGCGTGVNAVYLASQGFDVTAIDLSPTALDAARKRAEEAGVTVNWIQADVLNPPALGSFDLIFDRGCYHGVRRIDAVGYVRTVTSFIRPGGNVLIIAGNANQPEPHSGPPRVTETELVSDFTEAFDFVRLREIRFDTANPEVAGAWAWSVLLRRKTQ